MCHIKSTIKGYNEVTNADTASLFATAGCHSGKDTVTCEAEEETHKMPLHISSGDH